jgi:hypothetical protein
LVNKGYQAVIAAAVAAGRPPHFSKSERPSSQISKIGGGLAKIDGINY